MRNLENLNDDLLLKMYYKAILGNLSEDYILKLEKEINRRVRIIGKKYTNKKMNENLDM